MKFHVQLLSIIFLLSTICKFANSARILGVFPIPLASHCTLLQTVTIELAKRGHELVVFTGYSARNEISQFPNYREIVLEENANHMPEALTMKSRSLNYLVLWWEMHKMMKKVGGLTLEHPHMMKTISPNSGEKFDLIIIEWLGWSGLNALGYRFNAPVIGLLSIPINIYGRGAMGIGLPLNMIDKPNFPDIIDGGGKFVQRLKGLASETVMTWMQYHALSGQQEIVEKNFGNDYPHVYDLMKNVSMVFGTQDTLMPYPTIGVPNMINMGGIHVRKEFNRVLPEDMREFMEGGKEEVIYFSLGSTMKGIDSSEEVRNVFLQTFAELPYRVLWKWENDTLPGKPENVFISKWMPQRAILAHPSVKLYIYQGGLQSTEEAIFAGVPLVGIPLFADQPWNVDKMVSVGAAVKLEIDNISKKKLKTAILEVIKNEKYKQRMVEFRDLVNDRPYDPLNNTMWWIEYVIRHKGAHHLKIARANLPWYQANHIDTLGCIFLTFLLITFIVLKIIKMFIRRFVFRSKTISSTPKMKLS